MVKKGDEWKDLKNYVEFRIQHLTLEKQKVPFCVSKKDIEKAVKKLEAKIQELRHLKDVINRDIKSSSKYEYNKVLHLKKMKADKLRKVK